MQGGSSEDPVVLPSLALRPVSPCEAEAQQVKLRATIQVALTERLWGVALARFKEEIESGEKSISLEVFDKGKLYIDDEVVDAVASGAIEMGVAGLYQLAKKVPAIDIMEQPFLFNFDALVRAVVNPDSEVRKSSTLPSWTIWEFGSSGGNRSAIRSSYPRAEMLRTRTDQGAADPCFR